MKQKMIVGLTMILMAAALLFLSGCPQKFNANVSVSPEPEVDINPVTGEPYQDIPEKRGVVTNITEFNELLRRASGIESYRYTLTDTGKDIEAQHFLVSGRFVKLKLDSAYYHSDGTIFDEIMMDRLTKTTFTHCSKDLCKNPVDKEVEHVEYEQYYQWDPIEYTYRLTEPEYIDQELMGNQYVKVFNAKFEGKEARVWLQEYYGFPLRIIVRNEDNSKRVIEFEDMMVNEVRSGEVELPFNFTVSGEGDRKWWTWQHYLGELDDSGITLEEFQRQMEGV